MLEANREMLSAGEWNTPKCTEVNKQIRKQIGREKKQHQEEMFQNVTEGNENMEDILRGRQKKSKLLR